MTENPNSIDKTLSRRDFLSRMGPVGAAVVGLTVGIGVGPLAQDRIKETFWPDVPKEGQFLAALYAPRTAFLSVDRPIPTSVDFTLRRRNQAIMGIEENIEAIGEDMTHLIRIQEGSKMPLFYAPRPDKHILSGYVRPEDIRKKFAVPVFGSNFITETYMERLREGGFTFNSPVIIHRGKYYTGGGVWYALTDYSGKFVNPDGQLLQPGENPYYIPSAFVKPKDPHNS